MSVKFDTDRDVVLASGDICDWHDMPVPFRFAADKKRAMKLVRNCETLTFYSYAFDAMLHPQKGTTLTLLDSLDDDVQVALTFNGTDCVVYGPIRDYAVEGADNG